VTRDVRRDLEAAGTRPVPDPSPDFESSLEDHLLAMARDPAPSEPASPPRPRRPSPSLVAGVASLVLLIAVVGLVGVGRPSAAGFELTDAVNVEVVLADGTTLVDPDGLVLPDAAVVTVMAGGTARIGDVMLRAGDVATIDGRRIRVDRATEPGIAQTDRSSARTQSPMPTASSTGRDPSATPAPSSRPAPTDRPPTDPPATDRPPTPRPDGTSVASVAPGTPKPSVETAVPRTPAPTRSTDVRPLKLEARAVGGSGVGAIWSGTPGARHYILVATRSRAGAAPDPVYPGSSIVGEFTRPPSEPLTFRVRDAIVEIRLLVVALDAAGAELTRSNIATVRFPR
jgi:hypothetical protein